MFFAPLRRRRAIVVLAQPCAGCGLSLAPAFRHGFGEVGEEHGEPEPDRQLRDEAAFAVPAVKMPTVVSAAPTMVTNMTGFFTIRRGFELSERVADRRADDLPVKEGSGMSDFMSPSD